VRSSLLLTLLFTARVVAADCGAAQFTPLRTGAYQPLFPPIPPPPHNALYITDPANQQYALFDLDYGGALASLRYLSAGGVFTPPSTVSSSAAEYVWGHHPGGMVQYAWFQGGPNFSYNPTAAGDLNGRGSPILGAACKDGTTLIIYNGVVDFTNNQGLWDRAATVKGGSVYSASLWTTPYTITTTVTFVANPGGTPAYYLKLDSYVTNIDTRENLPFLFGSALYTPGTTGGCTVGCDCDADGNCTVYHPESGPGALRHAIADLDCSVVTGASNPCPLAPAKIVFGKYFAADHVDGRTSISIAFGTTSTAELRSAMSRLARAAGSTL